MSRYSCELTALEELHLDSNRISTLPENCGAWAGLRVLTISDNNLTGIFSLSVMFACG